MDVALVALSKVVAEGDIRKRDILLLSIQSRINDLEDFYGAHSAGTNSSTRLN